MKTVLYILMVSCALFALTIMLAVPDLLDMPTATKQDESRILGSTIISPVRANPILKEYSVGVVGGNLQISGRNWSASFQPQFYLENGNLLTWSQIPGNVQKNLWKKRINPTQWKYGVDFSGITTAQKNLLQNVVLHRVASENISFANVRLEGSCIVINQSIPEVKMCHEDILSTYSIPIINKTDVVIGNLDNEWTECLEINESCSSYEIQPVCIDSETVCIDQRSVCIEYAVDNVTCIDLWEPCAAWGTQCNEYEDQDVCMAYNNSCLNEIQRANWIADGSTWNITFDPTITISDTEAVVDSLFSDVVNETGAANFSHLEIDDSDDVYLELDGVVDYVSVGVPESLNLTKNFTLSVWIYWKDTADSDIIKRGTNSNSDNKQQYALEITGDDLWFITGNDTDDDSDRLINNALSQNVWMHIACTLNDTHKACYLDGVFQGAGTNDIELGALISNLGYFGARKTDGSRAFNGSIDEVRIYNISLNQANITAIYNSGRVANSSLYDKDDSLVGWWKMDEGVGISADDSSGEGNDGTLVGDTSWSTWGLGDDLVGYWSFDGDNGNEKLTTHYDFTEYNNDGTGVDNAVVNSAGCLTNFGGCLHLDGVDDGASGDSVVIPDPPSIRNHTNFTVMWWEKPGSYGHNAGDEADVVSKEYAKWYFGHKADGNLFLLIGDSSCNNNLIYTSYADSAPTIGEWSHIVFRVNDTGGAMVELWKNGVSLGVKSAAGAMCSSSTTDLHIGRRRTTDEYFNGSIDEIMIFNTSLTATQILAIYNNQSNRFKNEGTQRVRAVNITNSTDWDDDGYNRLNLTANFENDWDSNLSARIGQINISVDPDGLVLYIPFEWGSAVDISGYGNDGAPQSTVTFNITGGANETGGFEFSEELITSRIDIADADILSFGNGLTDEEYTISAWINYGSTYFPIVGKYDTTTQREYYIQIDASNQIRMQNYDESGNDYIGRTSTTTTTPNQWYHIAGVYNATMDVTGFGLFINGQRSASSPISFGTYISLENKSEPLTIGRAGALNANGTIDEVLIWNRALTDEEILNLYNNQSQEFNQIYYTPYQNLTTSDTEQQFTIDTEADFVLPDFLLWSGNASTDFYSPILNGSITLETWNAALGDVPPTSNSPADASYSQDASATVGWTLTDSVAGGFYNVTRNGTVQNSSSSWTSGVALDVWVNTTAAAVGEQWNYTVFYNDSIGQEGIPDEVLITITAVSPDCWVELGDDRIYVPAGCRYYTEIRDTTEG